MELNPNTHTQPHCLRPKYDIKVRKLEELMILVNVTYPPVENHRVNLTWRGTLVCVFGYSDFNGKSFDAEY